MIPFKVGATMAVALSVAAAATFFSLGGTAPVGSPTVVAAVSEWGALARQLTGSTERVATLLQDPNADPHQHEATVRDAAVVAGAKVVIENGVGYDTWLSHLVDASGTTATVLNVGSLAGVRAGSNPHLFYDPRVAIAVTQRLATLLAPHVGAGVIAANEATVLARLRAIDHEVTRVRTACAGTPVAATEDVATYLLDAMGLDVVTPESLRLAIGNGVDPSVADLATATRQLGEHPALLIDNVQTQTPLTDQLVSIAREHGVPVVDVTETMTGDDYVGFLAGVVNRISSALSEPGGCL